MDLLEKIGPVLGAVAFLGLAVLVFLLFQQSREVRRLRDWAGRAPERAAEAADASQAAAEARGEGAAPETKPSLRARIGALWGRVASAVSARWRPIDRRLPIDGRIVLVVLLAGVVAAAVLTSGFGLVGDDDDPRAAGPAVKREVAVLNATQMSGVQGVPNLAHKVATEAVKQTSFKVTHEGNAPEGVPDSVVAYESGPAKEQAQRLARELEDSLGETGVQPMDDRVGNAAQGAPLALLIGQGDAEF